MLKIYLSKAGWVVAILVMGLLSSCSSNEDPCAEVDALLNAVSENQDTEDASVVEDVRSLSNNFLCKASYPEDLRKLLVAIMYDTLANNNSKAKEWAELSLEGDHKLWAYSFFVLYSIREEVAELNHDDKVEGFNEAIASDEIHDLLLEAMRHGNSSTVALLVESHNQRYSKGIKENATNKGMQDEDYVLSWQLIGSLPPALDDSYSSGIAKVIDGMADWMSVGMTLSDMQLSAEENFTLFKDLMKKKQSLAGFDIGWGADPGSALWLYKTLDNALYDVPYEGSKVEIFLKHQQAQGQQAKPPLPASRATSSPQHSVADIWKEYLNRQGDAASRITLLDSEMLKVGTVDAQKALSTATTGRIPAYLVRFHYNVSSQYGDRDMDIQLYYVHNPRNDSSQMMWKGGNFISQIHDEMARDDFVEH